MRYFKDLLDGFYIIEDHGDVQNHWIELAPQEAVPFIVSSNEPSKKQFTPLEMLDMFTEEEQLNILDTAMRVVQVKIWYDRLLAATFITVSDPRTIEGFSALVNLGLLTAERKNQIVETMM